MATQDLTHANTAQAIVIFGGAGFIGGHLMERLRSEGFRRIVSVDIRPPRRPAEGVEYIRHDVRALDDLDLGGPVPVLFNLAAVHTTPGHAPWEYYDANVLGAVGIIRFARRHQTRSIIFTSSISVYGPDEIAKDERATPTPVSDYGRSKFMAEQVHRDWLNEDPGRKLVIARPAVVFGPGEGGNFTRLARMLKKGGFLYPGRRDTIKSCIYFRDLVSLMLDAARREDRFILFNGAFSDRYTIEEIVETFRKVSYPQIKTVMVPAGALKMAAAILRPLAITNLGIHPDRIEKLMVSTNIVPGWAEAAGLETRNRLQRSLEDWKSVGKGEFV